MMRHEKEIAANLERSEQSIQAAKELLAGGYYDFAAFAGILCGILCSDRCVDV